MTTPTDGPTPGDRPSDDPFAPPPSPPPPPVPNAGYPPAPAPYGAAPPGYAGGPYAGAYPGPPKTSQKAIGSLVSAVVGLCICGIVLGPVAIALGVMARRDIAASGGAQTGSGLATGGIVLGVLVLLLGLVQVVLLATGTYPGLDFDVDTR